MSKFIIVFSSTLAGTTNTCSVDAEAAVQAHVGAWITASRLSVVGMAASRLSS